MKDPLSHLLSKYDVAGPRYTSYPTVPAWTKNVQAKDYQESLRTLKPGENLSLYFHLPFCENLCHFCGCMKVITKDHSRSRGYVDAILKEIKNVTALIPENARTVSQLHLGGGTPNFLQPEELSELMMAVRSQYSILPDAEIAIEMHPRTSTPEFCEALAKHNFNRISLGVQDFDPKVQKLINRHQSYEMTEEMVVLLRRLGFQSFNFDLIYGLPGQTLEGWEKTLQQVIGLRPNRLAVYSYAHVPWLQPYQRSFEDKELPEPSLKLELFQMAYETFSKNGYQPIGMDHFALKEDELSKALTNGTIHRNFMGYSTKADAHQIGFGVSAISYVGGNYFQNEKDLEPYLKMIETDQLTTHRGYLLNRDDHIRRDLIRRIMCQAEIDIPEFEKNWNIAFSNYFASEWLTLSSFVADGILDATPQILRVKGLGHLFLRNIAMVFDVYLPKIQRQASTPIFSRTV